MATLKEARKIENLRIARNKQVVAALKDRTLRPSLAQVPPMISYEGPSDPEEYSEEDTQEAEVEPTPVEEGRLPPFLTPVEVAQVLRKPSVRAVYTAIERGQIPGVIRDGSKILVDRDVLLKSLHSQKRSR